jgi:cyclic nucleotide gated channel
MGCPVPIAFSKQPLDDLRVAWAQNPNVTGCLQGGDDFGFGIYSLSVPLVTDVIPVNKILLPLFWGVMTMSSFGNALTPTDHTLEVAFSILVVTCGLLLFTMLIGNIQVGLISPCTLVPFFPFLQLSDNCTHLKIMASPILLH